MKQIKVNLNPEQEMFLNMGYFNPPYFFMPWIFKKIDNTNSYQILKFKDLPRDVKEDFLKENNLKENE